MKFMFDLSKPADCRAWLRELRVGPMNSQIEYVFAEDGTKLTLDEASDEQVMELAQSIAEGAMARGNQA